MSRPAPARLRARLLPAAVFCALLGWVLFLRWPSFAVPLWNVDESIHAAIARTLLDGGSLYRDAIDQRTPLTYWLFAGVTALGGRADLFAVRLALALLIATVAFGLFLVARRTRGLGAGLWAALCFAALSTDLLPASDAFAAHTEWAVIACTVAGAWWFWRGAENPGFRRGVVGGALFALAFLAKQPALLDFAAPLATTCWLAASGIWSWRTAARLAGGLLAGFAAVVGLVALWFALHGTLGDAVFYAWTYNLRYYGPEISWLDRAGSGLQPFRLLAHAYPVALLAGLAAAGALLVRLVQLRPTAAQKSANGWGCYLLVWSAATLAGAAAGGRGFEHYTIQCLPAFALAVATAFAAVSAWAESLRHTRALARLGVFAALIVAGVTFVLHPRTARQAPPPPPDPARESADFIRAHTTADDSLFVWGYNPDIHLYAGRKPASRFVYCSFLTGLIPWTNLDPQKDTAYAIVPGAMDALLADLDQHRPAFIVDCSPGPHRNFHKYPIARFPRLQAVLDRDYAIVDAGRFVPQGFRLHLLRDHARRAPLPLAGGPAVAAPATPQLFGPGSAEPRPVAYTVIGSSAAGRLQRLELLADGQVVDGVSVAPCADLNVALVAPFDRLGAGSHHIAARATYADGSAVLGPETTVACAADTLPPEKLAAFRVPVVARAITPLAVHAPFGPAAQREGDALVYAVHATSRMVFPLEPAARRVRGAFGLRPGAFAPDNPAATDGARFRILLLAGDGARTVLLERHLRPREVEADRPLQRFDLALPARAGDARLEFATDPGPADNAACDWTIWSDLAIDCSE